MSTIPIITPPPKKPPAKVSLVPQGMESWRVMLKKYSTAAWGLVIALPDFYSQILGMGVVPDRFSKILWGVGAFGLFCSWIKQRLEH
ncbi:hypothetical protein ACQR5W_11650 [Xanthomonas sacchari]